MRPGLPSLVLGVLTQLSSRPEKYLQALRALRSASALDATSTALHPLIVRFAVVVAALPADAVSPAVRSTLDAGVSELLGSKSVDAFNAEALQRGGAKGVVAAAKGTLAARSAATAEVEDLLFQLVRIEASPSLSVRFPLDLAAPSHTAHNSPSVQDAVEALDILRSFSSSRTDEFRSNVAKRFPLAKAFKSPEELEAGQGPRPTGNEGKEEIED